MLAITATPAPGLPPGLTHRSGLITSQFLLSQRYGYFEMRAQLPAGQGLWPAFWLLPWDGTWPPEIDVMEMLGNSTRRYYVSVHARPSGAAAIDAVTAVTAPDLTAGFHVFGVAWRPDTIRFFLDDVMVHEISTPADMHRPMYMLANLAVGGVGSWPGAAPPGQSGIFHIAWIRAWQFGDLMRPTP
jgi:beta-glucanase (GH16 family)